MSARVDPREAAAGTIVAPGWAPACGARTRAGGPCLGLAMANGRCRMHGGASTGPRTAAGLARIVAAKTTHGRYAMSGAAERGERRHFRTVNARVGLLGAATEVRAYLPAKLAARLNAGAGALRAPKHPSQVAFEALHATTPCACLPPGLGRRARGGAGGGGSDGAAVVALRGRATERRRRGPRRRRRRRGGRRSRRRGRRSARRGAKRAYRATTLRVAGWWAKCGRRATTLCAARRRFGGWRGWCWRRGGMRRPGSRQVRPPDGRLDRPGWGRRWRGS